MDENQDALGLTDEAVCDLLIESQVPKDLATELFDEPYWRPAYRLLVLIMLLPPAGYVLWVLLGPLGPSRVTYGWVLPLSVAFGMFAIIVWSAIAMFIYLAQKRGAVLRGFLIGAFRDEANRTYAARAARALAKSDKVDLPVDDYASAWAMRYAGYLLRFAIPVTGIVVVLLVYMNTRG